MTPYIILYLLLLLTFVFERNSVSDRVKSKIIYFWVIIFTLFRGLRWNTGTDWNQYLQVFLDSDIANIIGYDRGFGFMETGYMFLNASIGLMGKEYTIFLLLTNLFVLISYARFATTNSNTPIYVFIVLMFSTQFFPVRIGIAVAVILWGLSYFSEKRYLRVIVYTLLATSIHASAIIFLPIYFACFYRKIPTLLALSCAIAAFVLTQSNTINTLLSEASFIYDIVDEQSATKFEHYLDYTETKMTQGLSSHLNSVIFILTLGIFGPLVKKLNRDESNTKKVNYDFIYNMYFIFVILGIVFAPENMQNLKRIQNYFMFAFPILFSSAISYGNLKRPDLRIIFVLIFIMYLVFRFYSLLFSGFPDSHFPYISIFDSNQNRYT